MPRFASPHRTLALTLSTLSLLASAACVSDEPDVGADTEALCGITLVPKKSLIIHRADTANGSNTILDAFTFKAVLDKVVASSPSNATTSLTLFREWMSVAETSATPGAVGSFHCDTASVDPNNWGYECPRTGDASLGDDHPFVPANRFVATALVNRFDLMPANRNNCGEYRIIFARNPAVAHTAPGRFFFILEAKLPNPDAPGSADGCKAVGEFWQQLSDPALTVAQRRDRLRAFYFDGVPLTLADGRTVTTTPVFTWSNYAGSLGQLRTNQFVATGRWDLREFKLRRLCTGTGTATTCELDAQPVTVKTNLADDPLLDTTSPQHATAISAVQSNLVAGRLLAGSVPAIRAVIPNTVNAWESGDDNQIDYASRTGTWRSELTMPTGTLTLNNALDRLTTQTCMGCHQHSNNRNLGGGVTWPSSLGFVHVDESGNLSPAITNQFLPARATFFRSIVEAGCAPQAAPAFAEDDAVN